MCSDADPRTALAEYIRHKTDNGNQVVDYLHDVLHENLDGVKHGHRTRAAGILSEYGDLAAIRFQEKNKEEKKARPSAKPRERQEREDSEFDAALARVIRDKTNDTQDVADYLIDTMNGVDSAIESGLGKIRHQQRVSAAVELLRRAYDHDPTLAQPSTAASASAVGPVTPEARHEPGSGESDNPENPINTENPASDEEEANLQEILDIIKRAAEEADPSEWEDENPSGHKPDYSMWDIIESQPEPVITEEHARIGAALFHEAVERQRAWRESDVKIPARKDHDHYDDG